MSTNTMPDKTDMPMQPLLIELGTEELPVKALAGLAQAFFDGVIDGLAKRGIAFERDGAKPLYTPRRLAVLLPGVAAEQPEKAAEVLGPYLNIALGADGQPTRALQGFAAKAGVDWTALEKTTDGKGERFVHRSVKAGAKTADLLGDILIEALAAMPIPKPMRWGDHDYSFARPVHWLVVLLGSEVVDVELLGVRSDRMSRGHRFMHDKPVWFSTPGDYVESLRGAKVLVDADERRESIVRQVEAAAQTCGGAARIDRGILEEVNGLTEWPSAITCGFETGFLAVPAEALIATMETNQKFFPVLDGQGRLSEHFIGIANIDSRDEAQVREGYERVIRPRFSDARFFFVEDMKQGLASMNDGLRTVTYQKQLGSVADKVERVAALAEAIAAQVGLDPALARRAAGLSKADLQSRLVGEFPELQGIAGRYYAAVENEPIEVAHAIDEAYMPRFAGDAIAPSTLGQVLAIAERLDTLAGGFAAGLKPTGNKDPFALRRNALGLARTLVEAGMETGTGTAAGPGAEADIEPAFEIDLRALLQRAHALALAACQSTAAGGKPGVGHGAASTTGGKPGSAPARIDAVEDMHHFIFDRLRSYYADQGISAQQFDAVLAVDAASMEVSANAAEAAPATVAASERGTGAGSLLDFDRRLKAIAQFAGLPEAAALAAANKRSRNILRKLEGTVPDRIDAALFCEPAERDLAEAVDAAIADTDPLLAQRDYVAVLGRLARLRPQVDAFFDQVMVNADDPRVRDNRLALLKRLSDRLGSVAAIEHMSA